MRSVPVDGCEETQSMLLSDAKEQKDGLTFATPDVWKAYFLQRVGANASRATDI